LGDGGAATNASLSEPSGVTLDGFGNMYIADSFNQRIRKVDTTGTITTVAGIGTPAYSGDGGAATHASLNFPQGAGLDASGNMYIADNNNGRIRKVDIHGTITTVAGPGNGASLGDGGAATNASFYDPVTLAVDAAGNLYIADSNDNRIRKVGTNGIISTVAGFGPLGERNGSYSGDGGAATNACLNSPQGVALDAFGSLYIGDTDNQRVRKVDTNGTITTVAGNGHAAYSGDGGAATNASLNYPGGVALDAFGNLYMADSGNNRIRKVHFATYPTLTLTGLSATNAGNYTVVVSSPFGSVTSAVAALTVVTPLVTGVALNGDGSVTLNFAGLPNNAARIWAATNLTPPISWEPICTNNCIGTNGAWQFTDTNAVGYPARFYLFSIP
jgi:sugar lactone lactonase YvrE